MVAYEIFRRLSLPEPIPPNFVCAQGRRRIPVPGDLAPVVLGHNHSCVDVLCVISAELKNVRQLIQDETLADATPMTEIDRELEIRHLLKKTLSDQGMKG